MGRRKPGVPGRVPDEQLSLSAYKKIKEEIEEMKNVPTTVAFAGTEGQQRGALNTLVKTCLDPNDSGGGIFHDYVRDYTQSVSAEARRRRGPADVDLKQSRLSLSHNSRFVKLDEETQFRSNPDWVLEHQQLCERHGSWFRVKTAQEMKQKRAQDRNETEALPGKKQKAHNPVARQLKDLQSEVKRMNSSGEKNLVATKLKASKFGTKRVPAFEGDPFHADPEEADFPGKSEQDKVCYRFLTWGLVHYGTLMEMFKAVDVNNHGTVSRREFAQICWKKGFLDDCDQVFNALDKNGDGLISVREFHGLKPFLEDLLESLDEKHNRGAFNEALAHPKHHEHEQHDHEHPDEKSGHEEVSSPVRRSMAVVHRHESPGSKLIAKYHALQHHRRTVRTEEQKKKKSCLKAALPSISLPQTCSLTVFRNADKFHEGIVIFLKEVPSCLATLYDICGKRVQPVLGTVTQLLDRDLRPLRSLDDLQPGGRYLAKGPEALYPPPAFWGIAVKSMRQNLLPKPAKGSEPDEQYQISVNSFGGAEMEQEADTSKNRHHKIGVAPMVAPFTGQDSALQKAGRNAMKELKELEGKEQKELDVLKAEGQSLRREIMSSTTRASTGTPLNPQTPLMSRTTGSFMNRTSSSGWSNTKGSSAGAALSSSTGFRGRSPDLLSRTRDLDWSVYERALGDITYLDAFGEPSFPQLRSVQSTPALMDQECSMIPPKPGMVHKATVITPEFNMRRHPSLPSI